MTEQAKLYLILTNKEKQKCIFLTPKTIDKTKPNNPEIIYDGKDHAILYKTPKKTIIIDYIPKEEQKIIKKLPEILVVEYDLENKKVVHEYMAKITISKLPDISKQLITK